MAATLQPEKILKELRELWVELGQGQAGENHEAGGGVLRACAMTLLVAAEPDGDGRDAEAAHRTIGVLMHDQPSRAIVIVPREGGEGDVTELRARVFSECWMPFGSQQQICAEGIEISTDAEQTDEVARLLVPLIAPDLPVMLWCRGPQAFRDRSLDPLFALADKIIFDTARVRHASSAIEFLRRMRHSSHGRPRIADLAWTRLTGWREAVAHVLGGGLEPGDARVTAARVTHCGEKPGTSPLYFARWIEKALPAATVTLEPAVADAASTAAVGLCGVTFTRVAGEIAIHQKDAASLEVREGAKTYASPLPGVSEEVLLGEELSILGSDPVFDRVLG